MSYASALTQKNEGKRTTFAWRKAHANEKRANFYSITTNQDLGMWLSRAILDARTIGLGDW